MLTNKITGDIYIGQSKNLARGPSGHVSYPNPCQGSHTKLRFNNYFNISYLKSFVCEPTLRSPKAVAVLGCSKAAGHRFTYETCGARKESLIISRALIKYAFDINYIQGASLNSLRLYTTNTKDSERNQPRSATKEVDSQVVSDHPINP